MMEPNKTPYYRPSVDELPRVRRRLTNDEVIQMQMKQINESEMKKVWPHVLGLHMMAGAGAFTSFAMLLKMRQPFKLGGLGLLLTSIPTIGLPYGGSVLAQTLLVQYPILTGQQNQCAQCIQLRGTCIQAFIGVFYPLIFTPLLAIGSAKKYQTAPVPPLYPFSELRKNACKLVRPARAVLAGGAIVQLAMTYYIIGKQHESFFWLMNENKALVHTR